MLAQSIVHTGQGSSEGRVHCPSPLATYCHHLHLGGPDLTFSWAFRECFLEEGTASQRGEPQKGVAEGTGWVRLDLRTPWEA